jgi:TRAP-type C4-dicarboxylate transport system substrate-binding protein
MNSRASPKEMIMRWTVASAVFAGFVFLCGLSVKAAEKPITLTLATWGTQSHPHEKEFVTRFIEAAQRESAGRLAFKYFPNGSMVKQDAVVTAVPNGLVDIALMIVDSWAGVEHDVSITTTPLWTLSMENARTQMLPGQPIYNYFAQLMRKHNIQLLCLFDIGPPVIASRFPLKLPEDLKGKVIRALSKGTAEDLQALGASPIVMGVGQVYAALQRHTVDGAMNGIQGSIGLRYYEVASHEMATGGALGTIISGYVMNLKRFESLPPELQTAIQKAASETRSHTQDYIIRTYPDYLKEAASHGMEVFELKKSSPEWDAWQSALSPFKADIRKSYSDAITGLLPQ